MAEKQENGGVPPKVEETRNVIGVERTLLNQNDVNPSAVRLMPTNLKAPLTQNKSTNETSQKSVNHEVQKALKIEEQWELDRKQEENQEE